MNFTKNQTIYMQIANHLIEQILREELKAGDKVPSVRELAATTEVNPNTVMRTISYLQEQDIIFNKRGIGNFVSDDAYEKTRTMRKEDFIQLYLPEFFKTMKLLKMDLKDLEEIYKKQMNRKPE
jgi:GntR family transcriptional regulator